MKSGKRVATMRERELIKRCLVLAAGSLFFFLLAAVRAMSMDYADPMSFAEEDYDVMSYDDHVFAARLKRQVVGSRPVYNRRKASQVHDAVTIVINEVTSSELSSSNDLKRDASQNWNLNSWLKPRFAGGVTLEQHDDPATISYSNSRAH